MEVIFNSQIYLVSYNILQWFECIGHGYFICLACSPVVEYPPNPNTNTMSGQEDHEKQPANFYWELMENQPDHLPGYVDPLIVDDTQGDFGGNPIIRPERKFNKLPNCSRHMVMQCISSCLKARFYPNK